MLKIKDKGQRMGENSKRAPEMTSEKRKSLRNHLLVLKVMGELESKVFFGYAKNISRDGMFIPSVNPKKAGEEFFIEFTLPREKTPIRCKCEVEWSRDYKHKSPYEAGMGIRFLELDEETGNIIDECVRKDASPFV